MLAQTHVTLPRIAVTGLGFLTLLAALGGCARHAEVDPPDSGAPRPTRDGGTADASASCSASDRYYIAENPQCHTMGVWLCPNGHELFTDDCGCGCTCPDPQSSVVDYLSQDPEVCARADWDCPSGSIGFDSECGCGCIQACPDPDPTGCWASGCPAGEVCDPNLGCAPSSCVCQPETGEWACTDDCGGGTCRPPATDEVVFRLSFMTDAPPESIFVQRVDAAGNHPWLTVFDAGGEVVPLEGGCWMCPCDQCDTCALCGGLPPLPTVDEVPAGTHLDHVWNGWAFPRLQCASGAACIDRIAAPAGRYVARFCYSGTATGVGEGHTVGSVLCDEVPFDYPVIGGVVEDPVCWCG